MAGDLHVVSHNNTLRNNIINSNTDNEGIEMRYSSNNTLINNTANDNEWGIEIYSGSGNVLIGNNFDLNDDDNIVISSSSNTILINNSASSSSYADGIILNAVNSTLINNVVNSNWRGIYIYGGGNNTIIGTTANSNDYGFYFTSSTADNTIINSTASGNSNNDVYARTSSINNTLLNVSYSTEYVDATSQIFRKWFVDIYVRNETSDPISDIVVSLYNQSGYTILGATQSNGYLERQAITAYVNYGGVATDWYPYNVSAEGVTVLTNATLDWGTDGDGNYVDGELSITLVTIQGTGGPPDTTPPVISSPSPPSGYNFSSGSVSCEWNITTNESAECRYQNGTNTIYQSMTGIFDTTGSTLHTETLTCSDGQEYKLYVRCNDTSGNVNDESYYIRYTVSSGSSPPPTEPQNLDPTPTGNQVTVDWDPPSGGSVDHYEVEIYETGNPTLPVQTDYNIPSGTTDYSTTLPTGGYIFTVRAVNGDMVAGAWSQQSFTMTGMVTGSGSAAPGFEPGLFMIIIAAMALSGIALLGKKQ